MDLFTEYTEQSSKKRFNGQQILLRSLHQNYGNQFLSWLIMKRVEFLNLIRQELQFTIRKSL